MASPTRVPGFFDVHIHGAFGVDFVEGSPAQILEAADRLGDIGYDGFFPTTVTLPPDRIQRFLDDLPEHPLIRGVHLEGPFLSPKYPGAQPPEFIRDPVDLGPEWDQILDDPRVRLVTLAPELPGAKELISRLQARGVVCSMGHTDATFSQASESGVTHATHTYNAMRGLHHREAGALGATMDAGAIHAEIIYDRVHVTPPAARILAKTKGPDRMIAVSDGTMAAGLDPGMRLRMWGLDVEVGEDSVRLLDGTLAGSSISLRDAYDNLREDFGHESALRWTSINPRAEFGETRVETWLDLDETGQIVGVTRAV